MSSGIYQITNQVNGKRYVGSAMNLRRRWGDHLRRLRRKKHENAYLQRAFNSYGQVAFVFEVLEYVDEPLQLISREQYYLDTRKPQYNLCLTAGSWLGHQHSPETCRKMSEAWTPERKQAWSEAQIGERNHNYGKQASEETRRKMSETHRGSRNAFYGKHHSMETRRKMREVWTPERKQKMSQAMKSRHHSEESRKKMSEARKAWWQRRRET